MATPFTLQLLKAELVADTTGLGFAAHMAVGNDTALAALLNAVNQAIVLPRGVVVSHEVAAVVDKTERGALSASDRDWLTFIVSPQFVDLGHANVRSTLGALFGVGTATRAALLALADRKGSRAEQLWGQNVSVEQVSRAREV